MAFGTEPPRPADAGSAAVEGPVSKLPTLEASPARRVSCEAQALGDSTCLALEQLLSDSTCHSVAAPHVDQEFPRAIRKLPNPELSSLHSPPSPSVEVEVAGVGHSPYPVPLLGPGKASPVVVLLVFQGKAAVSAPRQTDKVLLASPTSKGCCLHRAPGSILKISPPYPFC